MNSHQLTLEISPNEEATLEHFCWSKNELAEKVIQDFLKMQSEHFLYLFGGEGTGKTHLLQALCHAMTLKGFSSRYIPLALFQEWGAEAIESPELPTLLAIDDIDVIANNKAFEEALFHLYNRIRDNPQHFLLIAAKKPPTQIGIQLPDLSSRLSSGLIIKLEELDDFAKVSVLKKHAKARGFDLSEQVALFLIQRCTRSMHVLSELLNMLDKASLAAKRKITIPFVKQILAL